MKRRRVPTLKNPIMHCKVLENKNKANPKLAEERNNKDQGRN
jgi:hypothetical protein